MPIARIVVLASALSCASVSLAVPPATLYYVRAGSTVQEQCSAPCVCAGLDPAPLRGLFVLRLAVPDPGTHISYNIENIQWRAPALGRTFVGGGTYEVESASPGFELLSLDIASPGNEPLHGVTGRRVYFPTPLIDTALTFPVSTCSQLDIRVLATPYRSDWNADASIDMADIFSYVNAWFAGDGDTDLSGQTTADDIFDFLNAWLARE